MAETFWCNGERVKFSNGATELLFRHWLCGAEARPDVPGMLTVAAFLRHRLVAIGDGFRAFGMDRDAFPAELSSPDAVAALASLLAAAAADASLVTGIDDPQHRAWWESRLWRLDQALRGWQPST